MKDLSFSRSITSKPQKLNLTALIDIIFLLVVFFMLTTHYQRYSFVELGVSMEESSEDVAGHYALRTIIVKLEADSRFSIQGQDYPLLELAFVIESLLDHEKNMQVVLAGGEHAKVQDIVTAMEQLSMAAVEHISVVE